jgi:hypothetical protein
MNRLVAVCLASMVVLSASPARAGWKIVQEDQSSMGPQSVTLLVDEDKLRVEPQGGPIITIIDLGKDSIILMNKTEKKYAQMKLSDFIAQMKAVMETAKAMLAQLPPEARKGIPDPTAMLNIKLTATGKSDTVNGFKAQQFKVTGADGSDIGEVWLSKDGSMGEVQKALLKFTKALDVGFGEGLGGILKTAQENGFPVRSIMSTAQQRRVSELKSVEKSTIDKTIFNAPTGYTLMKPEEMMGPVGGGMPMPMPPPKGK